MLWLQGLACFLVWIALGAALARHRAWVARVARWPLGARRVIAPVALLISVAVLGLALVGIEAGGGLTDRGLAPWAWAAVTLVGAVFVVLQVLAAVSMFAGLGRPETAGRSEASMPQAEGQR